MRDSAIVTMHRNTAKREALILDQLEFLQIRQHATELIDQEASWYHRLTWFFQPMKRWTSVDLLTKSLLSSARAQAAAAKAEKSKPKIEIVPGGSDITSVLKQG